MSNFKISARESSITTRIAAQSLLMPVLQGASSIFQILKNPIPIETKKKIKTV
jgi:hypothetical protein